ncbi:sensor histidine kinase [Anaerosacchariphilus polymeriproducens]|uniref:GHKL domain-containing protein n=1 Tax=Anaerosacchariphilus polymeriproducens TaxID=1812858 RepID=A0A371AQP0_9FIRM|nr:sensor histidine kinase [Anaerosacchariphilus polymeriproducens]RDU21887.1 GHKL domain-containing protein [Anaerosacchariphilus polymeriproducens]
MQFYFINILCFICECIKIYLLYDKVIGFKKVKEKWIWYITIVGVFLGSSILFFRLKEYAVFGNTLILLVIIMVLFKEPLFYKCIMFFPLYSIICLLDTWLNSIQEILIPSKDFSIFIRRFIEILISIVTIIILIVIARVKQKYISIQLSRKLIWYQGFIVAAVIVISCIFTGYSQVVLQDSTVLLDRILNFIFVCAWVALVYMVFAVMYNIIVKEQYRLSIESNEKVLKSQQEYYKMVLEKDQSIRRFRHDYGSHIGCIKMFALKQNCNAIINYIEEMEDFTANFTGTINTGNMIVDTIINDTIEKCKDLGITIEVSGMFPDNFKVSNMDVTTIFSNAIINAVEAAAKCKQIDKTVKISIRNTEKKSIIEMENPIAESLCIEKGILRSTKNDNLNHGFGILNIRNCLEKYNGILEFERKEEYIYTRIIV